MKPQHQVRRKTAAASPKKQSATQARRKPVTRSEPGQPSAPGNPPPASQPPLAFIYGGPDGHDLMSAGDGTLHLVHQATGQGREVTRAQARAWMLGSAVPAEFQADFAATEQAPVPVAERSASLREERSKAWTEVYIKVTTARALFAVMKDRLNVAWARFDPSDDGRRASGYLSACHEAILRLEEANASSEQDRTGSAAVGLHTQAHVVSALLWKAGQFLIEYSPQDGEEADVHGGLCFACTDLCAGLQEAVAELEHAQEMERRAA